MLEENERVYEVQLTRREMKCGAELVLMRVRMTTAFYRENIHIENVRT